MDAYQKGPVIGEGTYGSVTCATHKSSGRQVAIKKVRMCNGKEGINMSVLRELKALKALKSPYVVELLDVFTTKNSLVLVFEYMDWSLEDVIRDKNTPLSAADIKSYVQMMLQSLAFVHGHQVAHRDVKPDNMLINSNMVMKLADFGLARSLDSTSEGGKLTAQVFGRWYRPPELLMGCSNYGTAVDIWAAGCVLAELLLRKPWFPGVCDMDQLDRIFKVLGVPTVETWPGLADLPHRIDFKPARGQPLQQVFPEACADCLDLLQRLMQFDPQQRITAAEALQHPYFSSDPAPTPSSRLTRPSTIRGGRRNTSMVPALVQDMLMQPAMMLRQHQQQQQEGGAAVHGSSRQLFALTGQPTSFSGRILGGQGLQPGLPSGPETALGCGGSSNGLNGGGSRLSRRTSSGLDQLNSVLDDHYVAPWKGRLSFGSVVDEPAAPAGDQLVHKRASPMQQQQQSKIGSMRPPLHRNSMAGQQHGATPVLHQAGAAVVGSGDTHVPGAAAAMGPRRKVSDLAAALSSAAAGTTDGFGHSLLSTGILGGQQQPAAGSDATPAVGLAVSRCGAGQTLAGASDDADMACPMSLGTSAHKRSRAVFEAPPAAGQVDMQRQGSSSDTMQHPGTAMSIGGSARRIVRGRRSSMGSGCCSMETDGAPASIGAGMYQPERQWQHQPTYAGANAHGATDREADKQQQLENLLAAHHNLQQQSRQQSQQPSQPQPGGALLQLLQPWQPSGMQQSEAAAAAPADFAALPDCSAQQPGSGGASMSLDQRPTTGHHPSRTRNQGHYAALSGMKTGCSSAAQSTGGLATGGLRVGDLQALDPAELEEMAKWWRPRLDSAERRYLRCRKLQMDEALLQASQHDDDEAPDNTFGSPEFKPRGVLFGSPSSPVSQGEGGTASGGDGKRLRTDFAGSIDAAGLVVQQGAIDAGDRLPSHSRDPVVTAVTAP